MSPMKKILQVFLPALMVACLSVACAEKVPVDEVPPHIEPAEDPFVPELNILFIGNSLTMDAVTHLPGLVSAAGIKKEPKFYYILSQAYQNRYRSSSAGTPITDENAPVALQAARLAIANPYSIMDMSGR